MVNVPMFSGLFLVPSNGHGRAYEHTSPARMTTWCLWLLLDRWPAFRDLLLADYEEKFTSWREAEGIGRPLGTADFVTELDRRLGRPTARRAPGRKPAAILMGEQLNFLQ